MRRKKVQAIMILSALTLTLSAAPVFADPGNDTNSVSSSSVNYTAQEKALTGNTATPKDVMNLIDKLPSYDNLTVTSEKAVNDVYNMYLRLSDADKKKVLNIDALYKMQDKLEQIHEQARYTYLFNMTEKKRSAIINISYALVSSADGQYSARGTDTSTNLANTDMDLLFQSPDGESFTINQATTKLDRKDIHMVCNWQGADIQIKISDSELGSWLVKAPVPISMAVQSYADAAAMEQAESGSAVSVEEQTGTEQQEEVNSVSSAEEPDTEEVAAEGPGSPIGLIVSVALLFGGFGAFVHFKKKKSSASAGGSKNKSVVSTKENSPSIPQKDEEEEDPEKEQQRLMRIMQEDEKRDDRPYKNRSDDDRQEMQKQSQITEDNDPDIEIIDDSDNDVSHEEVDEHPAEDDETIERRNDFFTKKNRFS